MKSGRKTLAVIVALMMLLSLAAMMTSCADDKPTEPSTSVEPTTTGGTVKDDEPIALDFSDGLVATADVKQSREITVRAQSNYLLIKGSGKFTVKVGDAEAIASDDQFEVKLENTADVYTEMVLTIEVDEAQNLSFTLVHNPGTEGNPYEIAVSGDTKVDYTEGTFIKITDAGWYNIIGNEFFLTNYIVGTEGVTEYQVYLPAGTYGISAMDKKAESSVTVTRVKAPEGYSENAPKVISELGEAKLVLFTGTKLYFQFNAPEDGLYVISTGSEGKGANCRFAVSADDYATYYGKYYENGDWLTCEGGKNYALHMVQDGTVTIMIDYTADENMVGSDEVSINISMPKVVEQLDELVSNTLEKKGKAYFSFTAEETGTYTVALGLGDTNGKSRIQIWTRELAEGREDAVTYEWVKGEYCDGIAYVKVEAGETIYIVVDSEKNAYGNVSVQVSAGAEEPLPDVGWESFVYKCDDVKIKLDRDAKMVALNNFNAARFYYLDGKATFKCNEVEYTLEMAENGKDMVLSYVNGDGETVSYTLVKVVPVEISKWQGVYADADGNEMTIFSNGAGIIGMKRYIIGESGTKFNADENLLAWSGDYIVEINELNADGRVASVKVSVKKGSSVAETVIYTLKSAEVVEVPEYLPIGNEKYVGSNDYNIINGKINGSDVVVLKKIDDNTYMVSALTTDYDRILMKVVVEKADDKVVKIKLYNENDELLSELAEPVIVATPDLKTDGGQQDTSKRDENYDGMYYVKIPASGWYTFYGEESVEIFAASEVNGVASANWSTKYRLSNAGVTKQYSQGDVIAFYNGNFTASYSETEPVSNDPGTENNPYVWDGSDLKLDSVRKESTDRFYISFTPSASGTYMLKFTHSEYSNEQINVFYNGAEYGRWWNDDKGSWGGWEEYSNRLPVQMKLTAGEEVSFSIAYGRSSASGWTMTLEEDKSQGGDNNQSIKVESYGNVEWTAPTGGTFTVSGGNSNVFIYTEAEWNDYSKDPVAFAVLTDGATVTLEAGAKYIIVNEGDDDVALSLTAASGSNQSIEVGSYENVEWTAPVGGTFTVSGGNGNISIYTEAEWNDYSKDPVAFAVLTDGATVTLEAGVKYIIVNEGDDDVTLTLIADNNGGDISGICGTWTGSIADENDESFNLSLIIRNDGTLDYTYSAYGDSYGGTNLPYTFANGEITFTYSLYGGTYDATVTLSVVDGGLYVNDDNCYYGTVSKSEEGGNGLFTADQQGTYRIDWGTAQNMVGSATLTINESNVQFYHMNGGYNDTCDVTVTDGAYRIELLEGDYLVFAFEDGGLTINYSYYSSSYNGTAIKA